MGRFDNWEPAQESKELGDPVDLRGAALGPKGYKVNPIKTSRKRKIEEPQDDVMEEQQQQQPEAMDADGGAGAAAAPGAKRQRVEGEPYRTVSGKVWKGPGTKAGTYKSAIVGTTWEKKMAAKATKKVLSEQKAIAVGALKAKRKAKAQQREAAKIRKKENQAKSVVVQKITNAATVKKMMKSKKQRKLLKTADTN
ncbi:hypothetical protein MNEG_6141 [Monoraphidium neglectum]|uniref:Coiled-coil domain-containing protein 86 n=1 Tax=Monoraphidium neglectum TaxID=145388 RepID=A0A0D2N7M1_9CHLO|nr:hypothetical protein MNEG_6141 [Monoraphidium neglectum]KIZ01821.1 hypothetical protein MNEG_6141 [Monoraphidium neglectum]|eukprot:XP_013900840.1 hypothetical protein MNEG_6141 [Monoraphidium neglectum]